MSAAGVLPKPQLRRLLEKKLKGAVIGAVITSIATGIFWKLYVMDPRKRAYAEFYKNYDAEAKFREMCNAGVLTACKPGDYP